MRAKWLILLVGLLFVLLGVIAAVAIHGLGGSGSPDRAASRTDSAVPAAGVNRFDGPAAFALLRRQVAVGQRPAGTPQLRALADKLRPLLPHGRFEAIPGEPSLRNVVGSVPGRAPAIVVGAHYDTLVKPEGFQGANNGAGGTAIVIQLARTLAAHKRPAGAPALKFVLFDGEEPAAGLPEEQTDFYDSGLRGSRAYVAAHPSQTRAMVLLDYVAGKGLRLPHEATSTPSLWGQIRAAAQRVGVGEVFPDRTDIAITDDHTPFLRANVPAVDLIDWSYPGHQLPDGLSQVSERSVDAVGETITDYLLHAR